KFGEQECVELVGRLEREDAHSLRGGQTGRARKQRDAGAPVARRFGERVAHAAARPIRKEADRVEGLAGRAGRDEETQPGEGAASERVRSRIAAGSAIRPTPSRPLASGPDSGPTIRTPRERSASTLRRTAACSHIRVSIAGARRTGPRCARKYVDRKSSASPLA